MIDPHQLSQRHHQSNGSVAAFEMSDEHQRHYLQVSRHYYIVLEFRIACNTTNAEHASDLHSANGRLCCMICKKPEMFEIKSLN